jgi:hypothetical protein
MATRKRNDMASKKIRKRGGLARQEAVGMVCEEIVATAEAEEEGVKESQRYSRSTE